MRLLQNKRFNERKQSLFTFILHIGIVSLSPSGIQQRETMFSREREPMAAEFFFFFPEFEIFHSNRFPGEFTSIFQVRQIGIIANELQKQEDLYILTWRFRCRLRRRCLSSQVSFMLTKGLQVSPSCCIVLKAANGELPSFLTEKNSTIGNFSTSTTHLFVCKVLSDVKGSANLYGFSFAVSYQCSRARVRSLQRRGTSAVILNQFVLLFTTIYLTR